MSNDGIETLDGMSGQEGFPRFAYGIFQADKAEDVDLTLSFSDADTPTETDLLPDDEPFGYDGAPNASQSAYEYDVAVIGGGPAGYASALRAAMLGARVILFEKDALGGLCLNAGCVPSKTYLKTAEYLRVLRKAAERGIATGDDVTFDMGKALSHKNAIITKLTTNVARLLRSSRVRVEAGEARLKSAHEIFCLGKVYTAEKIILCGGSRPAFPAVPGLSHPGVLTSGDILNLPEAPPRLLILGGGSAGCELATVFAAFGSNVMLIEQRSRVLFDMDEQISEAVENGLKESGVKVHTNISVDEISDKDGHPYVLTARGGVLCDKVLIATGRTPDLSCLGALSDEIELENGKVAVNDYSETSLNNIYAAGDVTGFGGRSHIAYRMAETAAENAMGAKKTLDLRVSPNVVFTSPTAASVGLSEAQAREKYGDDILIGISPLDANVRALISGIPEGFVKVVAGKKYGEILGVHIVCAEAAEMIAEPAALMRMEATIHEVACEVLHAHPTYAEAFMEACADALGMGLPLPEKK